MLDEDIQKQLQLNKKVVAQLLLKNLFSLAYKKSKNL